MNPKLAAARVVAVNRQSYLSSGLWRLRFVVVPTEQWCDPQGEIGVDRTGRVFVCEALLERDAPDLIAGDIVHELWHVLQRHAERRGERDRKVWNIAGDCTINPSMERGGWRFSYEGVTPRDFDLEENLAAEDYYDKLASRLRAVEGLTLGTLSVGIGGGGESGGAPTGGGSIPPPSGQTLAPSRSPSLQARGTGVPRTPSVVRTPRCGSGAGNPSPVEDTLSAPGPSESRDPADGSPAGAGSDNGSRDNGWEGVRIQVAAAIREAVRSRGDIPGEWVRWADEELEPTPIDWRRVLAGEVRGVLRVSGASDYTYSRPNRHSPPGVVLPSLRAPMIEAAIVDDTSGSRSDDDLAGDLADTKAILKAAGATDVRVIVVDAAVHADVMVTNVAQVRSVLKGGGGTDMRVGLERAAETRRGVRPKVVVVLTDGETPWPDRAPHGQRVIVVVPPSAEATPPWARRVERVEA